MMSKLKFLLLFATVSWVSSFFNVSFGQSLTERVLWIDTMGSYHLNQYANSFSFDRDGNFFFLNDRVVVASKDAVGNLCAAGGIGGTFGDVDFMRCCSSSKSDTVYVKNRYGISIYGPITGKVQRSLSGKTFNHIAVISVLGKTAFIYLDGRMVQAVPLTDLDRSRIEFENWVDFSENGNAIYYLYQNNRYVLYVNDQPVDTSDYKFSALSINDNGDYTYAKFFKTETPEGEYDRKYCIYTKDTVLDQVRTIKKFLLMDNGAYYLTGDDGDSDYIVLNGRLRRGIDKVNNITMLNSQNALYSFEKDGHLYLNVNGMDYPVDFEEIYNPTMDVNGHFAYYGLKDYFLYKVVDGKVNEEPLSKYGVRALPLCITPEGKTLHYFKTDDSVYLYQDDNLILKQMHRTECFQIFPWQDELPYQARIGWTGNDQSLLCLNYGEQGYFVYNGQLSEPLLPIKRYWVKPSAGCVVEGVVNEHGFFAIQYVGEKTFQVVVNNHIYKELHDIDEIISGNGFYDGKQVVFYGIKDHTICQFILSL